MKQNSVSLLVIISILFFLPFASPIYAADITTTDRLITVDLGKQLLTSWEGGKIVHQTKISSGLPKKPTIKGSFKIYQKIPKQDMKGQSKEYGKYFYKDVPYVMYFYQDYAIHGAYWHNRFGRPASHGCVNTPVASAQWLYNWAPQGTRVEVF